jgi:hypothetical protein
LWWQAVVGQCRVIDAAHLTLLPFGGLGVGLIAATAVASSWLKRAYARNRRIVFGDIVAGIQLGQFDPGFAASIETGFEAKGRALAAMTKRRAQPSRTAQRSTPCDGRCPV